MKKLLVRSIQDTEQYLMENPKENIFIINVGQTNTFNRVPQYTNFIELNVMFADVAEVPEGTVKEDLIRRGYWNKKELNKIKFSIIEHGFVKALADDNIKTIIIRCDAGASRSQAIATALSRKYNIDFDRNILLGNIDMLKNFEEFLGIRRTEEDYKEIFGKQRARQHEETKWVYEDDGKNDK